MSDQPPLDDIDQLRSRLGHSREYWQQRKAEANAILNGKERRQQHVASMDFYEEFIRWYQARQQEMLGPDIQREANGDALSPAVSSWRDINLQDAIDGKEPLKPTMLVRTDGRALVYPGKIHWFQGDGESMKSLVTQFLVADLLKQGLNAIFVDFEDDENSVVDRLRGFGVAPEVLLDRERFRYIHPDEPTNSPELEQHLTCGVQWSLVAFDGVTEAMVNDGLNYLRNEEIALWVKRSVKAVVNHGVAGIAIDHVPKNQEAQQAGYAIGGVYKRNVSDVSISFKVLSPLHRAELDATTGSVQLILRKDKHGWVRQAERKADGCIAVVEFTSYPDGGITGRVLPPEASGTVVPDHDLVLTILTEAANYEGATKTQLRACAGAKSDRADQAISWLIAQEYLRVELHGRAHNHHLTDEGRKYLAEGFS